MKLPILVVDDYANGCNLMAKMLSKLGYKADVAYDGRSALQRIDQRQYGLAVLDYQMPGMNGVELFRCIRRIQPDMAGVFVTAISRIAVRFPGIEAGVLNVFSKPVDFQKLIPVIEEHLSTVENGAAKCERTTAAATRLFQLAALGKIELSQPEKDQLTTDYLFVLAITNKLELNQQDKRRLSPLHLAHLAVTEKIHLSQEDKDRLPTDQLIELVLDPVTVLSTEDKARLTADDLDCLNEFEADCSESLNPV